MILEKRGQEVFGMSFGMIFTIILIIAVVSVGIYAIVSFIGWSNCQKIANFYDKLQSEVTIAWSSRNYDQVPNNLFVPSGITKVCFGTLDQTAVGDDETIKRSYTYIYRSKPPNVFLYPSKKACDGVLDRVTINNLNTSSFFCVPVNKPNGKVEVKISFREENSFVSVTKP